ncbi:MAG TPA: redoxin domain-containing protein [Nitrososphaerales archaeon]|nr:redoxin domain-containing protein [Nitrososphaerales archaeon]
MVPRVGQRVAEFSLPDTDGHERSLTDFTEQGTTVLVFFPFAFSGVCDKEWCALRDDSVEFSNRARIVGISVDSVFALRVFAQTYNIAYPLLSDFNKKVSRLYGVLQNPWVDYHYGGVAKRSVFVVDSRGILRYRWVTDDPSLEPPYNEVLKAVK